MEEIEYLTQRGWRLLPCGPRSKTPLLKSWSTRASFDLAIIREWTEQFPDCNWGVTTGPESGVFVLDVDGKEGRASLEALQTQHGRLLVTLTSITGRADGGEQRFFRYLDGREIRSSAGKLGQGLDVRGAGGYVIVPPSIHPTGRCYHWANPEQPISDPPRWLLELLNGNSRKLIPLAAPIRPLVEGQRNDNLFRFGCAMRRRGATQDEIQRQLNRKNDLECRPRLEATEVRKIAASAARYEPGGPDPLEIAWGMVLGEAHRRGYERFISLARHLQLARPGLPIALPLERIGGLMDCDWTQARRWRQRAVRDGWLRPMDRAIPHVRSAQYSFHEVFNCPTKAVSH